MSWRLLCSVVCSGEVGKLRTRRGCTSDMTRIRCNQSGGVLHSHGRNTHTRTQPQHLLMLLPDSLGITITITFDLDTRPTDISRVDTNTGCIVQQWKAFAREKWRLFLNAPCHMAIVVYGESHVGYNSLVSVMQLEPSSPLPPGAGSTVITHSPAHPVARAAMFT
ncbi:hypothetical protein HW555_002645 [Spodoptera exigua]|uniref:Uncharacterized protein n=1 Tax=Spodoptera exigua TaxID=7107 RepID=A0A835GPD4_SPOEX|nr:hypothetical protein HW555_002645 [Spodoptera exigua]